MKEFKTLFNPLVPIFRLSAIMLFWGIPVLFILRIITDYNSISVEMFVLLLFTSILFGGVGLMFAKPFWTETKNYKIKNESIEIFNFIILTKIIIKKDYIKGFSTSGIPYKLGTNKQIIIYLQDGKKWELMKFSYFNFFKIYKALIEQNYQYLGHEFYEWKWPNSRVYKYDKKNYQK